MPSEKVMNKINELMHTRENIRNIGIAAHIDHGKTTLSDNLLAGAGLISDELAGEQLWLDFDEQEQERGITIDAANVSMIHDYRDKDHLINLIDTPGHVDFGGDVTRAMRAIDGAVIVVDAVEGVMPQTETVVRQAIQENVKPVLFINKVDRLIKELKLTPDEMQQRFAKSIRAVNEMIESMAPEEYKEDWKVGIKDGSVAFGSALYNWAISLPYMDKTGITFADIINMVTEEEQDTLAEKSPLHKVTLNMVIKHLPNPIEAQKYRIPKIWKGDINSDIGKAMMETDEDGRLGMIVTKIIMDEHAGEVATGRVFSGRLEASQDVNIVGAKVERRTQQVSIYMGPQRVNVDEVPAGNIVAVTGLKEAISGETICDTNGEGIKPFESIKYTSEPVVTVAVEAKDVDDLPKLIEVLREMAKEDPTLNVEINEETGEHLLSGMGELHLQVVARRIREDKGVDIETSEPIVVYREAVNNESGEFEGRSPNNHNKLYFKVEPLEEEEVYQALKTGELDQGKIKGNDATEKLRDLGMNKDEAKNVEYVNGNNLFIDSTRGVQYLDEIKDLIYQAFEEVTDEGPLANEPVIKSKVKILDAKLHEDAIHRGPAQIIPASRNAIYSGMLEGNISIYEPMQSVYIEVPNTYMGAVTRDIQSRRGEIESMDQEDEMVTIQAQAPVAETFGFAGDIRSATEGKALWSTEQAGFEEIPTNLEDEIITEIRKRKGMKPERPTMKDFMD